MPEHVASYTGSEGDVTAARRTVVGGGLCELARGVAGNPGLASRRWPRLWVGSEAREGSEGREVGDGKMVWKVGKRIYCLQQRATPGAGRSGGRRQDAVKKHDAASQKRPNQQDSAAVERCGLDDMAGQRWTAVLELKAQADRPAPRLVPKTGLVSLFWHWLVVDRPESSNRYQDSLSTEYRARSSARLRTFFAVLTGCSSSKHLVAGHERKNESTRIRVAAILITGARLICGVLRTVRDFDLHAAGNFDLLDIVKEEAM
ncbi:hypothetical protein CKAH01_14439 [Colletotrichum kahawae]|uniref:Uncharacterized protein n=1 Tax=Colletotrichum kahawae TaxID=34407 RepID=A0AAE0D8L2_COLKA|nr:hypothetical protein CKAH01_14439 [Colletotrichum kahawae]